MHEQPRLHNMMNSFLQFARQKLGVAGGQLWVVGVWCVGVSEGGGGKIFRVDVLIYVDTVFNIKFYVYQGSVNNNFTVLYTVYYVCILVGYIN